MHAIRKVFICFYACMLFSLLSYSLPLSITLHAEDTNGIGDGEEPLAYVDEDVTEHDTTVTVQKISDVPLHTGEAVASISITVPLGRAKLSPKLLLRYSSSAGNGWVGVGWSLNMGAIQRQTKFGIKYDGKDFLFQDASSGGDLIYLGSNYYGLKIEGPFSKFYWNGNGGWIVTDKNGTKYFYGTASDSRQENTAGLPFKWCLDKVQDANGNTMILTYFKDEKEIYLKSIKYTGNVNGLVPTNTVTFYHELRPDAFTYGIGTDLVKTRYRLKTIVVTTFGDQRVSAYKFDYTQAHLVDISMLQKVQQFGSDALIDASGNITNALVASSLPPVTFTMSNEPVRLGNLVDIWPEFLNSSAAVLGLYHNMYADIRGNAKPDYVLIPRIGAPFDYYIIGEREGFVYLNQGDGNFTRIRTPMPSVAGNYVETDFNNDGKMDFMSIYNYNSGSVRCISLSNGNGAFGAYSCGYEPIEYRNVGPGETGTWTFMGGDFNGDGYGDYLVMRLQTGQIYTYMNNTSSPQVTFAPRMPFSLNLNIDFRLWNLLAGDFNGDGKTDFMLTNPNNNKRYVCLSNGDGTFKIVYTVDASGVLNCGVISAGDFNGDGKTDYMWAFSMAPYSATMQLKANVYLGHGDGTFANAKTFSYTLDHGSHIIHSIPFLYSIKTSDFNGDGKTDIVVWGTEWINQEIYSYNNVAIIFFGKGDGTFSQGTSDRYVWNAGSIPLDSYRGLVGDLNGDGKADLFFSQYNPMYEDRHSFILSPSTPLYHLTQIDNGKGGTLVFGYASSSNYSNTNLPFVTHVVESITRKDGLGNESKTSYEYGYGLYDKKTREFRGFGYVKTTRPDSSFVEAFFHQDEYLKGKVYNITLKNSSGEILTKTENAWEAAVLFDDGQTASKFVKLSQTRTEYYDIMTVFAQKHDSYNDTNGNLLSSVSSGSGAETITTINEYHNYGEWLWRKTLSAVTGNSTGKARETTFDYAIGTGNLLWKKSWNNNGQSPIETMSYYDNGNLWQYTDARGNITTIEYEPSANTYPSRISRPETGGVSHITQYLNYDYRVGKAQNVIDENAQSTTYMYDTLGRIAEINYPDGGQTQNIYYDFVFPQYTINKTKENGSSFIDKYNYKDGLGRDIQKLTFGESGKIITTQTEYDEMGRVAITRGPFFTTGVNCCTQPASAYPWTQTAYDYRGRPVTVTSPHGEYGTINTTFTYSGFSTTAIDPDGQKKMEFKDYLGRIIFVDEINDVVPIPGGGSITTLITKYTYNAAGDLLTITDPNSNQTSIVYDSLGRMLNMSDPDRGAWYYTYDPNGNLLSQKDAKNQTVTFVYDELNRLKTKTYPDAKQAVYTYDNLSIANGRGRLYSVTNDDVTTTVTGYDAVGRLKGEKKVIAGNAATYATSYAYDLSGKITGITYPDGYQAAYTFYPGTGLLKEVQGVTDAKIHALCTIYEPTGKIGQITYANGTATRYTYDPHSTKLFGMVTAAPTNLPANDLQRKIYKYTRAGDMKEIKDEVRGITYTYTYDRLHRLLSETNTGTFASNSYAYDDIGNITSKTLGTKVYNYNYTGAKKHAMYSINYNGVTYNYTYDANGNMLTGPDFTDTAATGSRTMTYNYDNMPMRVVYTKSGATVTSDFLYDHTGTRAKKASGGSTTYYVNPSYEVKDGVATKYISSANMKIAQIKGTETSYYHRDHLGSSAVMTNAAGVKVEATEYAPYGTIREHTGTAVTDYRYTGKELDTATNLYYYGARYYDPMIGRFVTPDPILAAYIQNGGVYKPVNLNLYHYAANNPLIYVDPDGKAWQVFHEWLAINALDGLFPDDFVQGAYMGQGRIENMQRPQDQPLHQNFVSTYSETPNAEAAMRINTKEVADSLNNSKAQFLAGHYNKAGDEAALVIHQPGERAVPSYHGPNAEAYDKQSKIGHAVGELVQSMQNIDKAMNDARVTAKNMQQTYLNGVSKDVAGFYTITNAFGYDPGVLAGIGDSTGTSTGGVDAGGGDAP